MSKRLEGRVALITGGTSGIGEATAELFVAHGAKVVITGRSAERGADVANRLGEGGRFFRADVSQEAEIAASVAFTAQTFGRLDILFNNAGAPTQGSVDDVTQAHYRAAFDLLVGSVIFGMKHAVPIMRRNGYGRIINNSSVAGLRTGYGSYLYTAAKAAVSHVTRAAGIELGRQGITVNAISPGGIATPIFFAGAELTADETATRLAVLQAGIAQTGPIGRSGMPADVANAALFLADEASGWVNCHDLVVDAGMSVAGKKTFAKPASS